MRRHRARCGRRIRACAADRYFSRPEHADHCQHEREKAQTSRSAQLENAAWQWPRRRSPSRSGCVSTANSDRRAPAQLNGLRAGPLPGRWSAGPPGSPSTTGSARAARRLGLWFHLVRPLFHLPDHADNLSVSPPTAVDHRVDGDAHSKRRAAAQKRRTKVSSTRQTWGLSAVSLSEKPRPSGRIRRRRK